MIFSSWAPAPASMPSAGGSRGIPASPTSSAPRATPDSPRRLTTAACGSGRSRRHSGARRRRENIDLTVVGPEAPLERGVADLFATRERLDLRSDPGRRTARDEQGVREELHGTPRRSDRAVSHLLDALTTAIDAIRARRLGPSVVVKADGLAAGKGVVVADDAREAEAAVRAAMVDRAVRRRRRARRARRATAPAGVSFFVVARR